MSNARVRVAALAAVLVAALALLAVIAIAAPESPPNGQEAPSMARVQNHSPVQIGDDEGRLEASANTPDSVLVACKRDPGQPTVYSKGRKFVGSHIYSVADGRVGDGCNKNNTGQRLNQHWLTQGNLQSQVSNH